VAVVVTLVYVNSIMCIIEVTLHRPVLVMTWVTTRHGWPPWLCFKLICSRWTS